MTARAVILGFFGVVIVCGFTYFNDHIIRQTFFVINHMPISVYGALILFVLLVNPLLFRISRRLGFTSKEMIVAMTITLASCGIPGSSLMRNFTNSLNLPHFYNKIEPSWNSRNLIDLVPKRMLTDVSRNEDDVLLGFVQGKGEGTEHISPSQVPWYAWVRPLKFWIPLLLTMWISLVGLSLVTHKQWSKNEHLPYPIASFANSLLPAKDGGQKSVLFDSRLFWIGACAVFLIHINNYIYMWWPDTMIRVPTVFNLTPLARLSQTYVRGGGTWLLNAKVYFSVIGIAYFLSSDVSFSLGIGPILWTFVNGALVTFGLPMGESLEGRNYHINVNRKIFLQWGSCLGLILSILYMGRHYYLSVLKRALLISRDPDNSVEGFSVWGARIFIIFFSIFVFQLALAGLDWQLGLIYASITVAIYLMMSRILAETGLFFILPFIYPCVIVWGFFGTQALGPETLTILTMLTLVFAMDPRETLMPYIVNNIKFLELRDINISRMTVFFVAAILLGVTIAIPVTLYLQYDNGTDKADAWSRWGPEIPFVTSLYATQKLEALGVLEKSNELSGWERFAAMRPDPKVMLSLVIGVLLVIGCNAARLRWPRWPIHPVLFLTWWSWANMMFYFSFLAGWAIKAAVLKYGGQKQYQALKPLFVGIIAGEIVGAMIPMIAGTIYYFVTGDKPLTLHILPS